MEEVYFEVNITYRYEYYRSTTQGGINRNLLFLINIFFVFAGKQSFMENK